MLNHLVTIIMPVYNGQEYIQKAIESILIQTYKNFELIIVNDGSTDNTESIIKSYLKDPRIMYFYQQNMGVSAARNFAFSQSKGQLIGFLDSDDEWDHKKLEIQVEYFKNHPNTCLLFSDYFIKNEKTGSKIDSSTFLPNNNKNWNLHTLFRQNFIGTLTVLIHRNFLLYDDLFDVQLKGAEDYELWLQLALNNCFDYIHQPLATYRQHNSNTSSDEIMMCEQEIKAIYSFLEKKPEARVILGQENINKKLFNLYNEIGDLYSWIVKDKTKARHFYIFAYKHQPINLNAAMKIINTFIPRKLISYITWKKENLFKL